MIAPAKDDQPEPGSRQFARRLEPHEQTLLITMAKGGESFAAIARKIGCSVDCVREESRRIDEEVRDRAVINLVIERENVFFGIERTIRRTEESIKTLHGSEMSELCKHETLIKYNNSLLKAYTLKAKILGMSNDIQINLGGSGGNADGERTELLGILNRLRQSRGLIANSTTTNGAAGH